MNQRKGITLFRADDAPNLEETDMMSVPEFPPGFVHPDREGGEGLSAGATVKVLYRQSEEEGGFSLVYAWFKPHFPLPRHSHSADCLYYVIAGSAVMGNQTLEAGDGFFVPNGAPYQYSAGPEGVEVLEFRHARSFDMQITETTERYARLYEVAAQFAPQWAAMAGPAR